ALLTGPHLRCLPVTQPGQPRHGTRCRPGSWPFLASRGVPDFLRRYSTGSLQPLYEHSVDLEAELEMARRAGITSIQALDAVLVKSKQWGEEYLLAVIRNIRRYAAPGNEQLQPSTVI